VRAGRVVVKLRGPDDPMLELTAETDRGETGMIGDTVTGAQVTLAARATGAAGLELVLVRNGEIEEMVPVEGDEFVHTFERDVAAEGDRFRAHLIEASSKIVITNHVWVEYATPSGGEDDGEDDSGVDDSGGEDDGEDEGCGCRAGGGGAGAGLLLAAAALLGLRRRRSRR
jgi:MYXO-CTERM domain-containing protein